jgi:hypothetical protein
LLTSTEPAREGREKDLKKGNGHNHGGASLLHWEASMGGGSGRLLGHYGVNVGSPHPLWERLFCREVGQGRFNKVFLYGTSPKNLSHSRGDRFRDT